MVEVKQPRSNPDKRSASWTEVREKNVTGGRGHGGVVRVRQEDGQTLLEVVVTM